MLMSNYTTELRFICESLCDLKESKGYNNIPEIINTSYKRVFNFYYPIFDESYRPILEKKIIRHYYTREICEETVGLWKLRLEDKMNEIMPYYNKLYESELLKFNPFYDIDYTLAPKGRANESKKAQSKTDNNAITDFTESIGIASKKDIDEIIGDVTHKIENEITNDTFNENTDFTSHKDIVENEHKTKSEIIDKDTDITDKTSRTLNKNRLLNDTEKTTENKEDNEDITARKTGTDKTNVIDKGRNVNVTDSTETKTRTPELQEYSKTDNTTDDTGTGSDNRTLNSQQAVQQTTNKTTNENYGGTINSNEDSLDLYSDTPQGNLEYPNQGVEDSSIGATISKNPDSDFPRSDGQPYDPDRDYKRVLRARLNTRWLTNGRDIEKAKNQYEGHNAITTENETLAKNTTENVTDNTAHTRNYKNKLDGKVVTTNTGKETTVTELDETETKNIDETHDTTVTINETTQTDRTENIDTTKNFIKAETENTTENEITDYTRKMGEDTKDNVVEDKTTDTDEDERSNKKVNSRDDFAGSTDGTETYDRDKNVEEKVISNKDTINNKKFVEALTGETNHNIRNLDEYLNHAVGKISDKTYSEMLIEFRNTFINIDKMIIDELNDLFFMLF